MYIFDQKNQMIYFFDVRSETYQMIESIVAPYKNKTRKEGISFKR